MKTLSTKIFIVLTIIFLTNSCTRDTEVYKGKLIKLEFAGVKTIEHESWIKIDGVKYTHYSEYDLQEQDSYSIPASKSRYTRQGSDIFEPNNPFSIALLLSRNVSINSKKEGYKLAKIVPDQAYQLHIAGTLLLSRSDSTKFNVEVPSNYPVKISVIK